MSLFAHDEPPTIGERYASAIESSNLRLTEKRGAVDLMISAGLTGGLGMLLYRLVHEYQRLDETMKVTVPTNSPETRRVLVLMDLASLNDVKFELADFALELAEKRGYVMEELAVRNVVGRCLNSFLDDICGTCNGSKVTGVYGGMQPPCKICKGTGRRSGAIGQSDVERSFARRLLNEMGQMMYDAEEGLRVNRNAVDKAKNWIANQTRG